jgi:hypothetical protein
MFGGGATTEAVNQGPLPDGVDGAVVTAVRSDIEVMKARANAIVVADQETFTAAASFAQACDERVKRVKARFRDVDEKTKKAKASTDAARSAVLSLIRELTDPFDAAKRIADQKAGDWRRLENKRLADEADAKRREAEAAAEKKRTDDARALLKEGKKEAAQAVIDTPLQVELVPTAQVEVPKGTVYKAKWEATCVDLGMLVKAIAQGVAPLDLVVFNAPRANELARAQKEGMNYAGVIAKDVGQAAHSGR